MPHHGQGRVFELAVVANAAKTPHSEPAFTDAHLFDRRFGGVFLAKTSKERLQGLPSTQRGSEDDLALVLCKKRIGIEGPRTGFMNRVRWCGEFKGDPKRTKAERILCRGRKTHGELKGLTARIPHAQALEDAADAMAKAFAAEVVVEHAKVEHRPGPTKHHFPSLRTVTAMFGVFRRIAVLNRLLDAGEGCVQGSLATRGRLRRLCLREVANCREQDHHAEGAAQESGALTVQISRFRQTAPSPQTMCPVFEAESGDRTSCLGPGSGGPGPWDALLHSGRVDSGR